MLTFIHYGISNPRRAVSEPITHSKNEKSVACPRPQGCVYANSYERRIAVGGLRQGWMAAVVLGRREENRGGVVFPV